MKLAIPHPMHLEERSPALQPKAPGRTASPAAPIEEVIHANGQPLEPAFRQRMEARYGHDFGRVRIHADQKASDSAQSIGADAYTLGHQIAFRQGIYQPWTLQGQRVIAHELAHVVQQEQVQPSLPADLGSPVSALEQEANIAGARSTMGLSAQVDARVARPVVQRTLQGALIGGLTGLAGGALLGGLAGGPIGALVGGVVGLIGGAIVGEGASTRKRKLTTTEKDQAKTIFAESVDYEKIEITRDSLLSVGAPRTIGNTIHLKSDWGHFKGDTLDLTTERSPQRPNAPTGMETLIHEMTHVWQYQNGGIAYMPLSIIAQIRAAVTTGDRNTAYDWRRAHTAHLPWAEWNPEQQAEMVEDYNSALQRINAHRGTAEDYNTVSIAKPYIENFVQRRAGAPTFGLGAPSSSPSSGQANT